MRSYAVCIAICLLPVFTIAQNVKQLQLKNFLLQSSELVKSNGADISAPGFADKNYWYPVTVPCTVLTGLVANKVYPNPYDGMNNMMIPDASDSFNHEYHLEKYSHIPNVGNPWKKAYWYRTSFAVPAGDKGKLFQLIFKGINYRADVWLNGVQLADSSTMAGMFAEYVLNATKAVQPGKQNTLAVKIYPLDEPGLPAHPQTEALGDFYANGGPTGDIGKNVTMLCSVGWDWMPAVRDRNMGIWQPVYLRTTGNIVIDKPKVVTSFLSATDTTKAKLAVQLHVTNYSNAKANTKVVVTVSPETFTGTPFTISKDVVMNANENTTVNFSDDVYKQLLLQNPHIWWPHGYGRADLYKIRMQVMQGNTVSDDTSFVFGVRTVDSKYSEVNGWSKRDFYVNGKRIHLVGGAWVPDMMLQEDSLRFARELLLCKNANTNLVRIWGGGVAPPDAFFDVTDRLGLLVWEDFWITGDTHGEFKGSADYPYQGDVYVSNVISTIYRLRNHASLLVWTGGNEGHARQSLYNAMRDNVAELDGTRPFIPCSSGFAHLPQGWAMSWPDNKPGGVYSGGSYKWEDASYYFKKVDDGKDWLFKDETGIPSQGPIESLPMNIVNLDYDSTLPYPFNNSWGYHDACTGNGHYELYYKEMVQHMGEPTDLKDFSDKMQIMNADGYRSIFEASAHKLNDNGGVLLWKLNPAFPSVIWQIFDYSLAPNAGYFFMQNANEALHIQFNIDDSSVAVINRTFHAQNNLVADIAVYSMDGKNIYTATKAVSMGASDVQKILSLKDVLVQQTALCFVDLNIKDQQQKPVSHNVYWLQKDRDFNALKNISAATVAVKQLSKTANKATTEWKFQFSNTTNQIAFFVHPKITAGNQELFPAYWSASYFTLMPGESITATVSYPNEIINSKALQLQLSGWNRNENIMDLK